ncbi:DUF1501 domain-containing protein [Phaeobacter gallaeciensis]|uniref:Twin-arginine translocation pathway signal n=1 Tax=Phaeobacter gallaeciensis TaxID=60890 RepID=A0AAD0EC36_9RHOB|nr:DUF1501 domain-containing protein [Phaeobacter gallaeciensis]AHD08715.1 Uncharacterized protein in bacteria [Phaeobacter gallaeciensis DSM 26640]ATE91981.1 putative protein in bacteria [Phaeobacter gallaeciensis]ATE98195.1 putative protein in bacteria [Phaeobacter gallaeciensis]ATF00597.1 putative protein in bacteria [Phaeobacter gallaeciensis]ATF05028.1 putative protein in bacteria [Phaeobacter gallaeciensis]
MINIPPSPSVSQSAGLSRRSFLTRSGLIGCSLAASPLLTPVSFAAAPWDTRLVVIILRGGMDAIDVVQPYGDPAYAGLRSTLMGGPEHGALDLDGYFALHPALAPLMPLWKAEQLGFIHAVSTPYRNKRSHFDGQDLLEAGTPGLHQRRDGWLNRLLQVTPGVEARTAFAIGQGEMKLLQGAAPVSDWSPDAQMSLSPQAERLAGLMMEQDPLFHSALSEALDLAESTTEDAMAGAGGRMGQGPRRPRPHQRIASYAAQQLRGESRIAAFSINGWDTHNRQTGALKRALRRLSETILTLHGDLGPGIWDKTAVVAMTEFGRTVRENGTGGTDHGTGGAMVLAGGAIKGGRVHGQWPGLAEAQLFDRRDLMPTGDVRAQMGWIMRGMIGTDHQAISDVIFPGVELGSDPGLLRG